MVSKPHGGRLTELKVSSIGSNEIAELKENITLHASDEVVATVYNIASGVLSPIEGFLIEADFRAVIDTMRLSNGVPWTIPTLFHVPDSFEGHSNDEVTLVDNGGRPVAVCIVDDLYRISREEYAKKVFGTEDLAHPGVAKVLAASDRVIGGRIERVVHWKRPFEDITLFPKQTRALFTEKGWNDVVAFQTRNAPHIGHEYVQKMALLAADGLFINPVLGKKKSGDFRDEVIVDAYRALLENYYPPDSFVMSALNYEMQYGGPKEAIMHAIMRKNFGCTKIAIGRDHAGVGSYYGPYAAQDIFKEFPDIGIEHVPMREFYYCNKCEGIANDRICPHAESDRLTFSGTVLRKLLLSGHPPPHEFMRPEVAQAILRHGSPFVE